MNYVWPHPNDSRGFECPICKTSADRPVVLVPIPGTESDGNMEARQIHNECYNLFVLMLNAPQLKSPSDVKDKK